MSSEIKDELTSESIEPSSSAESKPAESKPAESKLVESEPVESKNDQSETNKPTVSSDITESSEPTETSKPAHTHTFSAATCTTPAKCSCGVTHGSATGHKYIKGVCSKCSEKDPTFKEKWTYENGGYDYIIKTNGAERIKINIDKSFLPPEIEKDEYGYDKRYIDRYNFFASDNYIFFCQKISCEYIQEKEKPGDVNSAMPIYEYFCKINKNGTGYTEIGVPNDNFGHKLLLGYHNQYAYCMLGPQWAPYGEIYRIKIDDSLNNFSTQSKLVFSGENLFNDNFGDIINSRIDDDWIFYSYICNIDDKNYKLDCKIKLDGTQCAMIKKTEIVDK